MKKMKRSSILGLLIAATVLHLDVASKPIQ
jgi:hypothetical protein